MVRTLNVRPTLLTNLQAYNTVLLTIGKMLNRTRTYGKTFYNPL